jgi:hypothetical protein
VARAVKNGTEPRQPVSRSGDGANYPARSSSGGNDPLTKTAEVAVSDRLGAERRKSSTRPGCTVSQCGLAGAVAASPHLEHQGGPCSSYRGTGQTQGYTIACGCGDGVPEYVSGLSGQPLCALRWYRRRRTFGPLYVPLIATRPWQAGQRFTARTW